LRETKSIETALQLRNGSYLLRHKLDLFIHVSVLQRASTTKVEPAESSTYEASLPVLVEVLLYVD
jgi:hypothetical protein